MRKQLFLAIVERLKERVKEVKFIDLWNEQIATIQTGITWPLPAVFIEFEPYDVHQQANRVRTANVNIRLHIVTRVVAHNGSDDKKRMAQALGVFDVIEYVSAAINGLSGDYFSSFMLINSATNHNHLELIESIETFTTRVTDTSAARQHAPYVLTDAEIIEHV